MNWPLHVTVAAVIERDGQFLMVQESIQGQSVINQPAGHLEQNENLVEAVVRETLEETAWHFEPNALLGIYRWTHPRGMTYLRFSFTGNLLHEEKERALDEGIEQTIWLDRQSLLQREYQLRSPMVLQCVDDYLAGTRLPLSTIKDIL